MFYIIDVYWTGIVCQSFVIYWEYWFEEGTLSIIQINIFINISISAIFNWYNTAKILVTGSKLWIEQ